MTLIRWNPARSRDLVDLRTEMDRLFDGFFSLRPYSAEAAETFSPPVDVEETSDAFVVRADLPGVNEKDVKVNLHGDTLTLRAERKREQTSKEGSLHRTERVYGMFERSFTLGSPVRADQVKASYRSGVLEVRVPKAEEAKVREIEVEVG